jgi:ketosteroid isomerase-like protein
MKTRRNKLPAISTTLLIAFATTMSVTSFAKDPSKIEEGRAAAVKAAEIARFAAIEKSDAAATSSLLADDLEYCHSNGQCENKASYLEMMTSGKRKYVGFAPTVSTVRLFGDVAVVTGTAKVNVVTDGKPQEFSIGYTDVYVWRDKHWQMTSWRSTRFPDAPAK